MNGTDDKRLRNKEISVNSCVQRSVYEESGSWEMSPMWVGGKDGRDLREGCGSYKGVNMACEHLSVCTTA